MAKVLKSELLEEVAELRRRVAALEARPVEAPRPWTLDPRYTFPYQPSVTHSAMDR